MSKPEKLPTIRGPKLPPFKGGKHGEINYIKLLSAATGEDASQTNAHSHVFEVEIDGSAYALKIFRFYDPEEGYAMLDPAGQSRVSLEDMVGQKDPFYAECRAYGRLRNRQIAVPCHGYVMVAAEEEERFARGFGIDSAEWNRPEEELSLPPGERQPFRALVKDLVNEDPPVEQRLLDAMRADLQALNRLGIYVMDVRWDNYKGGKLIDFSFSWTEPCFELRRNIASKKEIEMFKKLDLLAFDEMVKEELLELMRKPAGREDATSSHDLALRQPRAGPESSSSWEGRLRPRKRVNYRI